MSESNKTTEDGASEDDRGGAPGAPPPQPAGASPTVRDVIGRRGYDEAEDEAATEEEQH